MFVVVNSFLFGSFSFQNFCFNSQNPPNLRRTICSAKLKVIKLRGIYSNDLLFEKSCTLVVARVRIMLFQKKALSQKRKLRKSFLPHFLFKKEKVCTPKKKNSVIFNFYKYLKRVDYYGNGPF